MYKLKTSFFQFPTKQRGRPLECMKKLLDYDGGSMVTKMNRHRNCDSIGNECGYDFEIGLINEANCQVIDDFL